MLFNIKLLRHIGQSVIGELLTIVGKKDLRCAMLRYRFLEDGISYSCGPIVRYGLCNGDTSFFYIYKVFTMVPFHCSLII